jgi:two-component system phosphate regulon response regulator PhoB
VRVLLVEDHPTMRRSLVAVLAAEGYEVAEARDGRDGLTEAAASPPDAIVLDLHVPGIDGLEVLRRLRADPVTAGVPVIVVTATGEEQRRPAIALGAAAYLTKPFGPPVLVETVARVLRGDDPPATSP